MGTTMQQVSCGHVYDNLAAAFRALCADGFEFVPRYYASPDPRHDCGFWRHPARPGSHVAAGPRTQGGALIWALS